MMTKPRIYFIAVLLLFMTTGESFSQQIVFNKVSPPDGNTFEFVTGITQDADGFMWFSTKKGLYSYDGNKVTSYKTNPLNPNSIMSNLLESVYADPDGSIWVGSLGKGLDRFDPETEIFTHYHHDPADPASLSNDTVTAILRDKQGTLWVGTHGGLNRFNPETNKFSHFLYNANDPASISNNQVRKIFEDSQGTIWIGTGSPYPNDGGGPEDGGLNRFNNNTGTFTRYLHDPNDIHSLLSNKVSAIFEDNQGTFWIGTGKFGLHKMNRQQGTFERLVYDPSNPGKLSGPAFNEASGYEHITFINQDAAGSYWFGTVDAGLYYFNPASGKIVNYKRTENSSSEFSDNGAFRCFTSRDNILWIGGTQGNIYHIDPLRKEIPHTVIQGAAVQSFYEDQNGDFWLGTNLELIKYNKNQEVVKRYVLDKTAASPVTNFIYTVYGDHQGSMWIGSTGGLYLRNQKNENFFQYKNDPKNINSLSNNDVISIYEDSKENFWIGTFRGLNLLDRKTGQFSRYFMNPSDTAYFGLNVVTSVLEDKTGKLWVTCWNGVGVNQFNRENKQFKPYLKGSSIMCSYEDADGILWVGGTDGLYKFNREIDDFIRYSDAGTPGGLSDVTSLVEDDQKYLWIGTSIGIVRLNPQRNETSTFGRNYGVGENTLVLNAVYKKLNGQIYFGDATGYFSFFPSELVKNLKAPEIIFTAFRLADHTVKPGDGGPINARLLQQPEIRLGYDQDVFSIDYAAIDYANPAENRLIYFLENYDNNWHQSSSEQRAYYFNIPPGKYTFRVKAVNSYGVWAEKKIDLFIKPPWWKTWWAYVIYGFLFLLLIFLIDRIQRKRVIAKERIQAREKELLQAREIEKAYRELKVTQTQLIQSEKMASLGELTAGIAHEIQNPLNFVNNFSEVNTELIGELNDEISKGNLEEIRAIAGNIAQNEEKINFHGKRADAIVKGMLQHSRSSNGMKEPTDINMLADEYLRLSYHGLRAKDKNFTAEFKTDFDENLPRINVVPQDIGRVLLNLINNAFYAVDEKKKQSAIDLSGLKNLTSPKGAETQNIAATQNITSLKDTGKYIPTVIVSTKRKGDKIEIAVKDNGSGIPQKVLDKIFQPFFTTKPAGQGTGLGLSLSYDIVKAHGGELKVETKEGEGSVFTITLNS
jgi:ligand-binding sensor domain-containing protein/signal transduction histidine kinase